MIILYTDGGCTANDQKDISIRKMVSVVTDDKGNVLVEKLGEGGSNNIAELIAVKEALMYCITHRISEVKIITDSRNNLAWVYGKKVGKKINDRATVLNLKTTIDVCREGLGVFELVWSEREKNLAGHYIESKYSL